ncbi:heterochromatin protein 1-binding protein 3 [Chanos chanos]|uniref:Heterochromatin protein 1-binding protein 3 n=1 Tax=Chanos chanos TaxID=29144 RepID=A0A6J2VML2_CHACN|nr:heterochromatin protein 1-binding protein 3 [Chanos chanos]
MPIRRAAGTAPQEQAPPAKAPEGEPDASSEESASVEEQEAPAPEPVAQEEQQPAEEGAGKSGNEEEGEGEAKEDGEKTTPEEEKTEDEGAEKQGKKKKKSKEADKKDSEKEGGDDKVKKVKRTIPAWATMSASRLAMARKSVALIQPKPEDILIEAIQNCKEKSGASIFTIIKYITKKYSPSGMDKRKAIYKKALKRLVEKGVVKQLKGKGFSGSFTIGKLPASSTNKKQESDHGLKGNLGDTLPLIITRLCEPKEASYPLIKKYLEQHFPQLNVESRPDLLKSALQRAVDKGHLERITGKGASGTFQLKRNRDKSTMNRGILEDAITTAITAMNEPKSCSISTLRKFLVETYKDAKTHIIVSNLKRTLEKCKMMGWMEQISGHGLSGSYQLSYPYYPSPAILFPEMMAKLNQKEAQKLKRKKAREESSDEEESEEESEEDEPPPKRKQQKRPVPKARHPSPSKKTKVSGKKPPPAKRPAASAKKAAPPAKKSVPPAKKSAESKAAPAKKVPPPTKATPVKKAVPVSKPKTPIAKKMTSRVSKRPPPKKSGKAAAESAVKAKAAARKSLRARK